MKISTRGRYSLRMMIDLAQHRSDGYITLNDIAKRQDISKKYLEQITPFLTRSELIVSAKGQAGGYALAKEPSEITVLPCPGELYGERNGQVRARRGMYDAADLSGALQGCFRVSGLDYPAVNPRQRPRIVRILYMKNKNRRF